jgi:hypothetical protein
MGGGGKGGGGAKTSPYEAALARQSQELYDTTQGLREAWIRKYGDVMSGTYDPSTDPTYAPMYSAAKTGLENQYNVARQKIIGASPVGGQLFKNLANMDLARASDVGGIKGDLTKEIVSQLLSGSSGTAFQMPALSIQGLNAANTGYSNRMAQAQASQSQAKGGMGSGVGGLLGQLGSAAIGKWW